MKKIAITLLLISVGRVCSAQTLFTYGNKSVSKAAFLKAFNKNPNLAEDRKQALREYLDLYINFRLKVQAAYDAGLNNDATQQYEIENFKKQLADNIINEQANIKDLVQQAFNRSQKEIHLAQVFVEVPENTDTTAAYKKIQQALAQLKQGSDFGLVASNFSTDEATRTASGDLGYITAFTLPYALENVVYQLQPGEFSPVTKTSLGYHIFKNLDERKPLGALKVAQILIAVPPQATQPEKDAARKKADSVYQLLLSGSSFTALATELSNDVGSSNNGGELPEFTAGTYSPAFEKVAFSLKQPGEVAPPIETNYGYHILKLLETRPVPTDLSDPAFVATLQEKVVQDNRLAMAKTKLIESKLPLLGYKTNAAVSNKNLFAYTEAKLTGATVPAKTITANSVLFSFNSSNVTAADWITYLQSLKGDNKNPAVNDYARLYHQFVLLKAEQYYRNNMQHYSNDYAAQVEEFSDANLLFSIMEKNVWGKASADTTALQQYYNQHKDKYVWPASADALIVTTTDPALVDELQTRLSQQPNQWRSITGSFGNKVISDSSRYELGQLPVVDRTNFTDGLLTAPVKNEADGSYTFNYIFKVYKQPAVRSLDDARGLVISDYQQVLEEKWLSQLRKKYAVKVNQAVFSTIK